MNVTLETVRNEGGVAKFQVLFLHLSRYQRKTTNDSFDLAGLRAEETVPGCPTVNSLTSQLSSQVKQQHCDSFDTSLLQAAHKHVRV
jgi:hypothetical protein